MTARSEEREERFEASLLSGVASYSEGLVVRGGESSIQEGGAHKEDSQRSAPRSRSEPKEENNSLSPLSDAPAPAAELVGLDRRRLRNGADRPVAGVTIVCCASKIDSCSASER